MDDQPTNSEQPTTWVRLRNSVLNAYCWGLIFVLVYVLSIGPVYRYWYDAVYLDGNSGLVLLYYPLSIACDFCTPLNDWVSWYVETWNS